MLEEAQDRTNIYQQQIFFSQQRRRAAYQYIKRKGVLETQDTARFFFWKTI